MLYKKFLKLRRPCPFCNGRQRTFLDRKTAYLTYALAPYSKYHLLVVPKRHVTALVELTSQEEKDIAELVKVAIKTLHELKVRNITSLVRDSTRDKSIAHLHYHVIPNHRIGDKDSNHKARRILSDAELGRLKLTIDAAFKKSR
jgi:diadenosine tetraphosphate (Ap4A) HIT family hydrolase